MSINEGQELMSFDILPDGSLTNVKGSINDQTPNPQYFQKLIYAAQKVLINEGVGCITVTCNSYILKLIPNQQYFSGTIYEALNPKTKN